MGAIEIDTYNPGRPIMTATELAEHHVTNRGRDYRFSDEGYSDMEHETKQGWKTIAGWGRDGWDHPRRAFHRDDDGQERKTLLTAYAG